VFLLGAAHTPQLSRSPSLSGGSLCGGFGGCVLLGEKMCVSNAKIKFGGIILCFCEYVGVGTYMCFKFPCVRWSGPYLCALMHWRVVACVCGMCLLLLALSLALSLSLALCVLF
jgi:hypothetical protein